MERSIATGMFDATGTDDSEIKDPAVDSAGSFILLWIVARSEAGCQRKDHRLLGLSFQRAYRHPLNHLLLEGEIDQQNRHNNKIGGGAHHGEIGKVLILKVV